MAVEELSKMDAVRQALKTLGKSAGPSAIQEYVKTLGIEMTLGHVSNYKTTILKKKRGKKTAAAEAAVASENGRAFEPAPAPVKRRKKKGRKPIQRASSEVSVQDIQAVKELVSRVDTETLTGLVNLLG